MADKNPRPALPSTIIEIREDQKLDQLRLPSPSSWAEPPFGHVEIPSMRKVGVSAFYLSLYFGKYTDPSAAAMEVANDPDKYNEASIRMPFPPGAKIFKAWWMPVDKINNLQYFGMIDVLPHPEYAENVLVRGSIGKDVDKTKDRSIIVKIEALYWLD